MRAFENHLLMIQANLNILGCLYNVFKIKLV